MAEAIFIGSKHRPDSSRIIFRWDQRPGYHLTQDDKTVTITFDRSYNVSKAEVQMMMPNDRLKVDQVTQQNGKLTVTFSWIKKGYAQTLSRGNNIIIDFLFDEGKPVEKDEKETLRSPEAKTISQAKSVSNEKKETSKESLKSLESKLNDKSVVQIRLDEQDTMLKMIFDFPQDVKAGAFIEGNDLWLYFDQPVNFSWDEKALVSSNIIASIKTYKNDRMSAVQLDLLEEPENTSFHKKDSHWILEWPDLRNIIAPSILTRIEINQDTGLPQMSFSKEQLGDPIFADMPGTGHPRYFIASSGQPLHVDDQHTYIDFYMPPTLQGIVIDPLSDGLNVEQTKEEIIISKQGGLVVSSEKDRAATRKRYVAPSLFNFEDWPTHLETLEETLRKIETSIMMTPKNLRTPKRLKLVRYYLASGRDYEAIGMLSAAKDYDSSLDKSPYFYSLRGLAHFIAQDYDKAFEDFTHPVISYEPEMIFWAEVSKAALDPLDASYAKLAEGLKFLKKYPKFLKNQALLFSVDAAIRQARNPQLLLDELEKKSLSHTQKEQLDYLLALQTVKQGDIPKALLQLAHNAEVMTTGYKYKTQFLLTRLRADKKAITPEEELKELNKLLYKWTGDSLEYDIWNRISQLYLESKNPELTLQFLSKSQRHYPKLSRMDDLQSKAEDIFSSSLKDGELNLLSKLALYLEFPHYIPDDSRRIDIRDDLIDMLVAANLIEEAMQLVQEQIKDPILSERDRFLNRLDYAVLALIQHKPDIASEFAQPNSELNLSEDLTKEQKYILAQAKLMQNKYAEVRDLLKDDTRPEAFDLISMSYIQEKDWQNLVHKIQTKLEELENGDQPVDSLMLVRLAMGLMFLNQMEALLDLRENYWKTVQKSPYRDLFDLMTSADPIDFTNTKALQEQLAEGQQISKIAENYRKKLKEHSINDLG